MTGDLIHSVSVEVPAGRRLEEWQRGFSMFEILLVLIILAFGMLALAFLQANTMRYLNHTSQQSAALQIAQELGERIRSNPDGAALGAYLFDGSYSEKAGRPGGMSHDCQQRACTSIELALNDLDEMQARAARKFYGGALHIEGVTDGWKISVLWREVGSHGLDPGCPNSAEVLEGVRCFNFSVAL